MGTGPLSRVAYIPEQQGRVLGQFGGGPPSNMRRRGRYFCLRIRVAFSDPSYGS
jgi:hypothetical protein